MVRLSKVINEIKGLQNAKGGYLTIQEVKEAIRESRGPDERTVEKWIKIFREHGLRESRKGWCFD